MLDELLDVFARNRSHGDRGHRARGLRSVLSRLGDDDRHDRRDRRFQHATRDEDDFPRGQAGYRRRRDDWWDD